MTNTEVIQAAEALLAQGKQPSIRAVRAWLGGGSFSTICDALRPWRERKAKAEKDRQAAIERDLEEHRVALQLAARNEAMLRLEIEQLRRESNRHQQRRGLAA